MTEQRDTEENPETDAENVTPGSEQNTDEENPSPPDAATQSAIAAMMAENFIEYASYVVKERAIPDVKDGLKPVQRRILHSLYENDDGRFHKVANICGHTMQYHPHGDASIYEALVVLANKGYFVDTQGNFGNIYTGDSASAARYIECRLTSLAREVLFNPDITRFIDSYDGRNSEPVTLPAKLPNVLLLGAEGIAVGMTTRILPHNFNEVLQAQIAVLKGENFELYPDFATSGTVDVNEYQDGNGKVKVRAKIDTKDKKTLVIREIPFSTTTDSLIASVEDAARKGKLKINSISDYTTDEVEVEIKLPRGVYAQDTIKQLFAYTDCEVSIGLNPVVIDDDQPRVMGVSDILHYSTEHLVSVLEQELQIKLQEENERFHAQSLVQIFIENRIYQEIENCDTYEQIFSTVREELEVFGDRLNREITDEDIEKLLRIHIRRISRFDKTKNEEELNRIQERIKEIQYNLDHLTDYAVNYIENLLSKYGDAYARKTEIADLERIRAQDVALANVKVGHDKENGFIGTQVRNSSKNAQPLICTEYDRLGLLNKTGKLSVVPVSQKRYVGDVKHVFKVEKDNVYALIYRDKKSGKHYVKRFRVESFVMEREYKIIPENCSVARFYTDDALVIRCECKHQKKGQDAYIELDLKDIEIRSRDARGRKIADREIAQFKAFPREDTTNQQDEGEGSATAGGSENGARSGKDSEKGDFPQGDTGGENDKTESGVTEGTPDNAEEQNSGGGSEKSGSVRANASDKQSQASQKKADSGSGIKKEEQGTDSKQKGKRGSKQRTEKNTGGKRENEKSQDQTSENNGGESTSSQQQQKKNGGSESGKKKSDLIQIDENTPFFLE